MAAMVYTNPSSMNFGDEEWGVTIKTKDVLYQELSSERTRAKQILGAVMRSWSISDPCDEIKKGLWRDPGEVVDLSFLRNL